MLRLAPLYSTIAHRNEPMQMFVHNAALVGFSIIIIIIIIKLALQHAHIKLRIMTCASTITLCMLEGMLASSASTLKVYNVH